MTSLLANLGLGATVKKETTDSLGGYQALPSDIYGMTCGLIHLGASASGAISFNFVGKKADGKEYRETIYITSGRKKQKDGSFSEPSPTYTNQDGTFPMPGWTRANNICLVTTGKGIAEQSSAPRTIQLFNKEAGKKINTEVECLTELLDKPLQLGIERILENKQKRTGEPPNVKWVDTPEVRTKNEITAVFHVDGMTANEMADPQVTEATFINSWRDSKAGKDTNKVREVKSVAASAAPASKIDFNAPAAAPAAAPATPVLPDPAPAPAPAATPAPAEAAPTPAPAATTPVDFN